MRLCTLLFVLFIIHSVHPVSADDKVFVCEDCAGEGTPILKSRGIPFKVYKEPDETSPVLTLRNITKGTVIKLSHKQTWVITRNPGSIRAKQSVSIKGYSLGDIIFVSTDTLYNAQREQQKTFSLREGDRAEQLQYCGEGTCFIRMNQDVIFVPDCNWLIPGSQETGISLETPAMVEWWIRLEQGWVRVDSSSEPFEYTEREF